MHIYICHGTGSTLFKVTEIDLHPYVSILYYMHYYAKNQLKMTRKDWTVLAIYLKPGKIPVKILMAKCVCTKHWWLKQDGEKFANDTLKWILVNDRFCTLKQISLKLVSRGPFQSTEIRTKLGLSLSPTYMLPWEFQQQMNKTRKKIT